MWGSIANLKENLNKIALDVHDDDDDEELSIRSSRDREIYPDSDRRNSHSFSHSRSPTPIANGFDSSSNFEIEQYKAEIKRLQNSEAEIRALSVNYAALLKEKEDRISRLSEENGSLKQNLQTANAALTTSKSMIKGSNDQLSNRQSKLLIKNRIGSSSQNGSTAKQDGQSNGISGNEKELLDLLEEKNKALTTRQATHEAEIKQLGAELDRERSNLSDTKFRLEEEQKLNASLQQEVNLLQIAMNNMSTEMTKIHDELNQKMLEIKRLQRELQRRDNDEADEGVDILKKAIMDLQNENIVLKAPSSERFSSKEETERTLQKLEKDLHETRRQKDKALQELNRLKQHLLDKESEEAEKMDEDTKIIEELRSENDYQKVHISRLEKALQQAISSQEDFKNLNENELKKSKEVIDELNRKVASCLSTIQMKNVEVLNLQTALGQYYAEIEAKERLADDLSAAKGELAKLTELLKEAYQQADMLRGGNEELMSKLSKVESTLAEGKNRVTKLEDDNAKLRRALEQSMTRLNRMSVDSDFLVDRRIVIKLLVTYFQRNHSREVLDLMVRMLGFSDEDKQRIGVAQQGAGKGVVRGVLGLPVRLVGGILGSASSEASSSMTSENQSFADLWVDFLLKETEEREKRESAANPSEDQNRTMPDSTKGPHPAKNGSSHAPNFGRPSVPYTHQNRDRPPSRGGIVETETTDSEFSTVPLSSEISSQFSRLQPRYS